jgi:chromosome segregation protein
LQEAQQQAEFDENQLDELAAEIVSTESAQLETQTQESAAYQALRQAETHAQMWQKNWDRFNQQMAEPTQRTQVERTRLQSLEQRIADAQKRLLRLTQEAQQIDLHHLEEISTALNEECETTQAELWDAEQRLKIHHAAVLNLREATQTLATRLYENQTQSHQLAGRLSALEALQEAALSKTDLTAWLHANQLQHAACLTSLLHVESGWEHAVEIVLGHRLEMRCVEHLTALKSALEKLPQGRLQLLEMHAPHVTRSNHPTLCDKVTAPWDIYSLLAGVWIADDIETAYALRTQLAAHESIITPQGIWLGQHWLISQQGQDEMAGVLARVQELQHITAKLSALEKAIQSLTQELAQQRETLHRHEQQRDQAQRDVNHGKQQLSHAQGQLLAKQGRLEHLRTQLHRITQEQAELRQQMSEDAETVAMTQASFDDALCLMNQLADQREQLQRQRSHVYSTVEQARHQVHSCREARHRADVRLEALRVDHARLQQSVERLQIRVEQLVDQRYDIQQNLVKQEVPFLHLQTEFKQYQLQTQQLADELAQAKLTVQHLENALQQHDAQHHILEQRHHNLRDSLDSLRLEHQTHKVRRQTLEEQLDALQLTPVSVLAELPEYADEDSWVSQIEAVARKLERLGSVNLAALQEYEEQMQRKHYLDHQAADLNSALSLLENAIRTIDRETRTRFQQTLDTVNLHLQEMFPRLFGGGQAYLQLTDEDVLKAGVSIMARPPGKRNSTIHLLSGGEKTLTAIALVFAIFQLNPAPFCMLDEVDAPLDDVNVGRFCTLVKSMSERVQFIFISHNKITMETAEQLVGVTMQEAGVSRPVAVDLEKAVDMVAV